MKTRLREFAVEQAGRHRAVRVASELASPAQREVRRSRRALAKRFIAGQGLEIGALHLPLPVPKQASVRYVDRMSREDLRREYAELASYDLVEVDVVADGEQLEPIGDASVDFVIANHFFEHTESPIATLRQHLRVLRPGGVLFYAIPDKRRTFDVDRPLTELQHLVDDEANGPDGSRRAHYEEWAALVEKAPDPATRGAELDAQGYSIHFHTWTPDNFAELVVHCRDDVGLPLVVEGIVPVRHEFIAILRHR